MGHRLRAYRWNTGASQFGVSWTETLGAGPRTEPARLSVESPASFSCCSKLTTSHASKIIIIIMEFTKMLSMAALRSRCKRPQHSHVLCCSSQSARQSAQPLLFAHPYCVSWMNFVWCSSMSHFRNDACIAPNASVLLAPSSAQHPSGEQCQQYARAAFTACLPH